jgi:GT2 family glycosyltransferase
MNVTAVTVTYGKRADLLVRVLEAARMQGAAAAVVIDNGAEDPVAEILAARFSGWAHVHSLGANRGSALGFKTGIALALARGAEFILLLDDDNLLGPDCLRRLCDHWSARVAAGAGQDNVAVHALRPGMHQAGQAAAVRMTEPRRGSFLGFHVAEIPYKLLRRLAPGLLSGRAVDGATTSDVSVAPYGGMLFHRDVIGRIGLPDEMFFLYVDDYEFAARLTAGGGSIHVVRDAVIHDIDTTWGSPRTHRHSALFTGRLEIQSLSKLYYATRNLTYFERHVRPRESPFYLLNKIVFMTILTIMALQKRRLPQYRTMLRGMRDGRRKSLGMNQAYQL